jgi:hypothetical protein
MSRVVLPRTYYCNVYVYEGRRMECGPQYYIRELALRYRRDQGVDGYVSVQLVTVNPYAKRQAWRDIWWPEAGW